MTENEVKHTPGPWEVNGSIVPSDILEGHCYINSARHFRLAQVVVEVGGEPYPEGEANARLIAAAPDLLLTLVELNEALDAYWNADPRNREPEIKALCEAQQMSFAAIAAAQ